MSCCSEDIIDAHRFCIHNGDITGKGTLCGCFYLIYMTAKR